MSKENRPKVANENLANLKKVTLGRRFSRFVSRTIPNVKTVFAGRTRIEREEDEFAKPVMVDTKKVSTISDKRLRNEDDKDTKTTYRTSGFKSPLKNLEKHPNINNVVVSTGKPGKELGGKVSSENMKAAKRSVEGKPVGQTNKDDKDVFLEK